MFDPEPPDKGKENYDWNMEAGDEDRLERDNEGNENNGIQNNKIIGTSNTNPLVSFVNNSAPTVLKSQSGSSTKGLPNKVGNVSVHSTQRSIVEKGFQQFLKQIKSKEQEKKSQKNEKTVLLYTSADMGPYVVYIQNKDGNIGKYHRISTAKLIRSAIPEYQDCIKNISAIGYNRIKTELLNAESANKLVLSKLLAEKNYEAYIPLFNKRRQGIIKNVDIDISEEELVDIIKPKYGNLEIIDVRRLKRKVTINDEISYVPIQTILVNFKGQTLPKQVIIEKIVFDVEPYIQRVVQCLKCLRYGHISKQCRGEERCKRCGGSHNNCSNVELCCALCKGDHEATDRKLCPEFGKQKKIKNLMSTHNISYKEALTKYNSSYAAVVLSNSESFGESNIINKNTLQKNRLDQGSSYYTQTIKRKRNENQSMYVPNNQLLDEHRKIVKQFHPQSQPIRNNYPPHYHNTNSGTINQKNIGEIIMTVIKQTLESNNILDYGLFSAIEDKVMNVFYQHST